MWNSGSMAGQIQVLFKEEHAEILEDLYTGVAEVIKEEAVSWAGCKRLKTSKAIRIKTKRAFLFAGQGAQKLGMRKRFV